MSSELEAVIMALASSDPARIASANSFLISYMETDASWKPCLDLVGSPNDFIRAFASNFLYTKLRKHWSKLSIEQRNEVFSILSTKIQEIARAPTVAERMVVNRLALALFVMCTRISNGVDSFLTQAMIFIKGAEYGTPIAKLVGLEMLQVVPPEVEQLDVARDVRVELEDKILTSTPHVLALLCEVASAFIGTANNCRDPLSLRIRSAILASVESWCAKGTTVDSMYEDYRNLVEFIFQELQSGVADSVRKASAVLCTLMTCKVHPRGSKRDEVIMWAVQRIVQAAPSMAVFYGEDGDDDVGIELCNSIVSVVDAELPMLVSSNFFCAPLFDMLLTFLNQKPRKISSITFEIWCNIQDTPVAERHPHLKEDIYTRVFEVILSQCVYTPDDVDDPDDLVSYRDTRQGIQEVVVSCYTGNRAGFLNMLSNLMRSCETDNSGALVRRYGGSVSAAFAASFEAVLYILPLILPTLQEDIKNPRKSAEVFIPTISFVHALLGALFSYQGLGESNPYVKLLLISACNFIGSCTFLLTSIASESLRHEDFTMLFASSLSFLFQCLTHPSADVAIAVSKAILKLTTHGKRLLLVPYVAEMQVLQNMLNFLAPFLLCGVETSPSGETSLHLNAVNDTAILTVVEAIVRLLVQLPPQVAETYISSLGASLIAQLDQSAQYCAVKLSQGGVPAAALEELLIRPLKLIARVIKFCDVLCMPALSTSNKPPAVDMRTANVLMPFLSAVWGALQRAEEVCIQARMVNAVDEILGVYSSVVSSCKDIVAESELPRVGNFVAAVFKHFHRPAAATCAASLIEALSPIGPALTSSLFVPMISSMAFELPRGAATKEAWREWCCLEDDTTGGVVDTYLTMIHRVLLFCPDVIFVRIPSQGGLTVFEVLVDHILGVLNAFTEQAPIKIVFLLIQVLFSGDNASNQDRLSSDFFEGAHQQTLDRLASMMLYYILKSIGAGLPTMLWGSAVDSFAAIVKTYSASVHSGSMAKCRQWIFEVLSDAAVMPALPLDARGLVLDLLVTYPVSERRRFKIFMQDLSKICNSELGVEALLDYALVRSP